jgi:5-methylcytosine-specific restriction enzyme subunit McrC
MANNIRIKNIYYMLAYAYQTLNETGYKSIEAEEFKNIHDLLSSILIKGVSAQIKRGLHRDYISQTETLGSLRGKIDITSSIKQQTMMTRQLVCLYDLFSEDTKLNQILKSAMMLLLRHGDVKKENKKALRKLLLYFQNVSEIDPYYIKWSNVSYHRNNAAYQLLINICWLIIKGLLLTTEDGKHKMAQFLDDQQMHRLYEKFVLGYYKKEYPQFAASASYIDWNIGDEDSLMFLPVMKSDITLTNGSKTLIIDTKYYGHTMQTNPMFNSATIISQNLYQIFTYVKNKDKANTGNVSGLLLYAKTDEAITPDNDYVIGGNRISVKTLDLGGTWEDIRGQLDSIASALIS